MRFLTGPEIHLAVVIWAFGAACGLGWSMFMLWIDKNRDEDDK